MTWENINDYLIWGELLSGFDEEFPVFFDDYGKNQGNVDSIVNSQLFYQANKYYFTKGKAIQEHYFRKQNRVKYFVGNPLEYLEDDEIDEIG